MTKIERLRCSLWLGGLLAFSWVADPALAQEAEEQSDPWMAIFLTWGPVLVIVGLWWFFLRRIGGNKVGRQVEQSLVHMERAEEHMRKTEEQNQQILEALEKIERHLRRSSPDP